MSYKLLGGGSSLETIVSDVNQNILELKNREITEIFKDEAGTRRVILDKDGLRTSPAGVDVVDATDDELTFNSNQNTFKIVRSGTATVDYVASAGQATAVVSHNLGYIPATIVYYFDGTNYFGTPFTLSSSAGLVTNVVDWYVDSTNLTLRFTKNNVAGGSYASDSTIVYKYYLLQETAN